MSDIVISEFMDTAVIEQVAKGYAVHYDPDLVDHPESLATALKDARALIVRNRTQVTAALIKAAPHLVVVGRLGVGLDNIDLTACQARGVTVCPATGANDLSVAEWVVASLMMLLRGAFLAKEEMLAGKWPRQNCMGNETAGKTLGLVGYGRIAREAGRLSKALGMVVAAVDPFIPADDAAWEEVRRCEHLEDLLTAADVVSLHVPLTDATRYLIDGAAIARMKPGAILINASRGGVLEEKALVVALTSGHLGGAALDVYESEPLTEAAAALFKNVPNLVLTPHIGGVTIEANQRVSKLTMKNVVKILGGPR